MNSYSKAKIAISLIIKRIPVLYLKLIYDEMIENNKDINYEGNINEAVDYLNNLYNSDIDIILDNINFKKLDISKKDFDEFLNHLKQNVDDLCFKANIGSYISTIEAHLSLKENDFILSKSKQNLLFLCFKDLSETNQIRESIFRYIKNTRLHTKYKDGDKLNICNYRFLFDHTKMFKIIDKLLSLELIEKLEKSDNLPNSDLVINNISRIYKKSIKENAYEITKLNEDIILLDISKAYDNVGWDLIEYKMEKLLSRKLGNEYGKNFTKKYLFLLKSRQISFKENNLIVKKGVATGLASSTIIFTLIFEDIFEEIIRILNSMNILVNNDYKVKLFVDDICIKILNRDSKKVNNILSVIENSLMYYNYKINKTKSKCSPNLNLNMCKLKNGDCYLGLPFSSSPKNYMDIILKQFNKKHININYKSILKILRFEGIKYHKELKNKIFGFFNFKLYGLKKYNINFSFDNFTNIILKYY
jgi:hypothetical protein